MFLIVPLWANLFNCQTAFRALVSDDSLLGIYNTPFKELSPLYYAKTSDDMNSEYAESESIGILNGEIGDILLDLHYIDKKIDREKSLLLDSSFYNKYLHYYLDIFLALDNKRSFNNAFTKFFLEVNDSVRQNFDLILDLSDKIEREKHILPATISKYQERFNFEPLGYTKTDQFNLNYLKNRFKIMTKHRKDIRKISYQISLVHELGHFLAALQLYDQKEFYTGSIFVSLDGMDGAFVSNATHPTSLSELKRLNPNKKDFYKFDQTLKELPEGTSDIGKFSHLMDKYPIFQFTVKEVVSKILTIMAGPQTFFMIKDELQGKRYNSKLLQILLASHAIYGNKYDLISGDDDFTSLILTYLLLLKYTSPKLFDGILKRDLLVLEEYSMRIIYDIALLYHYSRQLLPKNLPSMTDIFEKRKKTYYKIDSKNVSIFKKEIEMPLFLKGNYFEDFYHDREIDIERYSKYLEMYPELVSYTKNFMHFLYIAVATN